jgi:hypothetical protein
MENAVKEVVVAEERMMLPFATVIGLRTRRRKDPARDVVEVGCGKKRPAEDEWRRTVFVVCESV